MYTLAGVGEVTPIGPMGILEGKARARVGEFLGLRAVLNNIALTIDAGIRNRALELLSVQSELEKELPEASEATDNMSLVNAFIAVKFTRSMEKQIDDVGDLEAEASGKPRQKPKFDAKKLLTYAAIGMLIKKILL